MIDFIQDIAREAGELLRTHFRKDITIEFKGSLSNLVTEADKKSEKLIIERIQSKFPAHGILAEESGTAQSSSEYLWVIDPLDGTTNFAHGLPLFSVSIGLQKNSEIIAGAIYHVMNDEMYSAEKGCGAFVNNQRISVSTTDDLQRSLLVTGFPYNISENPDNALEILVELIKSSRGMRRLGSAAIDFCYLARGVFEAFWEVNLQPWDVCAGMLIVEEAGGITTDFSGREADIYSKQIVCSNKRIHPSILTIIQNVKSRGF